MSRLVAPLVALSIVLAGCGPGAGQSGGPSGTPALSPSGTATVSPSEKLVVGLGFIPSVQFAQFYLAEQSGLYEAAGLDVEFQNAIDPELITLLGQGAVDIGISDGTSLIPAVSQGIPVRYIATVYARFPNVVFAKSSSGIREPADLEGRRLGIPGKFGSSWIMLQALLASAELSPDDLEVVLYPDFGQGTAVAQDQVEAATGFVNNEPVQLELQGTQVEILRVDEITPLPGNGLVAGQTTLESRPDDVRAFVAATLEATQQIIEDPQKGLDATFQRVPDLAQDPDTQRAILEATIETWTSEHTETHGLGAIDRDAWAQSIEFMSSLPDTVLARPVTVDELVTEEMLDGE